MLTDIVKRGLLTARGVVGFWQANSKVFIVIILIVVIIAVVTFVVVIIVAVVTIINIIVVTNS